MKSDLINAQVTLEPPYKDGNTELKTSFVNTDKKQNNEIHLGAGNGFEG